MKSPAFFRQGIGAVDETRTRDLHLGKVALYQLSYYRMCVGAGDGNRTHVASLEGWNSTIELHPRMRDNGAVDETRTRDLHLGKVALYQLSYYRKTMGDRRRQGKQALWKLVRAKRLELIRLWHQILNLARLPFRHARTLHTTRMALRLPTPKSGRLFIILYAPSLVKAETAIFFCVAIAVVHRPRGNRKQAMAEGSAPFVHPLEGKKGESLPRESRGISRAGGLTSFSNRARV